MSASIQSRRGLLRQHRQREAGLAASVSALALLGLAVGSPEAACAQTVGSPQAAVGLPEANEQVAQKDIVVTGSRIIRDGYKSSTPLTVVGQEALEAMKTTSNVAYALNTMPVFAQSISAAGVQANIAMGNIGINGLNLRSLGNTRTLVLLDGRRSVGSTLNGVVDISNFPQQLISRVDIVTGGASAVYGSDAISGAVNFVLDKNFTGVKAEVSGGISNYGDDETYDLNAAGGFRFAGGRGHILLSAQVTGNKGVLNSANGRAWNSGGTGIMQNPNYTATNGQAQYLVLDNISVANASQGGIIFAGPLRGTIFGEGGVPSTFQYGPLTSLPWTSGGDWQTTLARQARGPSLDPAVDRYNLFARASYDVTDDVNLFVEASWADVSTFQRSFTPYQAGSGPVILSGNPFIPASVQARMTALGLASFQIGTLNFDMPPVYSKGDRQTGRVVVGAEGKFNLFDTSWNWDAYFQHGSTRNYISVPNDPLKAEYALAVDAVRAPNGTIVCRSTLTNPTNGCVPWNPLGVNVNQGNSASLAYFETTGYVTQRITQDVVEASVTGEPFSLWAGPVSVALNFAYRTENASAVPDPNGLLGNLFYGNFQPLDNGYNVTEGSAEVVVPLAKQTSWADSWDFSAAARSTWYSTSGYVTSWKLGTTYSPIRGIMFRGTRSHDIRAPNIQELYQDNISGFTSAFDPQKNMIQQFLGKSAGNANLQPEIGDTINLGVVLQPRFIPGLSLSADYFDIKVAQSIGSLTATQILLLCSQGTTSTCGAISRDAAGNVTSVTTSSFNLASQRVKGIDFEGTYRFALSDALKLPGYVTLHTVATVYLKDRLDSGIPGNPVQDLVGNGGQFSNGPPYWRLSSSIGYSNDSWRLDLTGRATSHWQILSNYIECSSGCPTSTTDNPTITNNHIDGSVYFDLSTSYRFDLGRTHAEAFFNVRNLFNRDPALVPQGPTDFTYLLPLTKPNEFDVLGRLFYLGVRFKL